MVDFVKQNLLNRKFGEVSDDEKLKAFIVSVEHQLNKSCFVVDCIHQHSMNSHKLGVGGDHLHNLGHLCVNFFLASSPGLFLAFKILRKGLFYIFECFTFLNILNEL